MWLKYPGLILTILFSGWLFGASHTNFHLDSAISFAKKGGYDSAVTYLNASLALIEHNETNQPNWDRQVYKVGVQLMRYDPNIAIPFYHAYLKKAKQEFGNKHWTVAKLNARLGDVYRRPRVGKFHRSVEYFEKSLRCFDQIGRQDLFVALIHHFSGSAYTRMGSYEKAIGHLLKAAEGMSNEGDSLRAAQVYSDLGVVYYDLQEYSNAFSAYAKRLWLLNTRRKQPA